MKYDLLIIPLLIGIFLVPAVHGEEGQVQQRDDLKKIRSQIDQYEKLIQEKKAKEANTLDLINGLDKEIDVTTSFISNLHTDIRRREVQIVSREKQISEINDKISRLEELVRKRMVSYYKHGRKQNFELLLSGNSINHLKIWLYYQKLIAENDRRTFQSLIDNKKKLTQSQLILQTEISEKERNMQERQSEESQLRVSRIKRQELLNSIRNDAGMIEKQMAELKKSQNQIKSIITKNEEQRLTSEARKPQQSRESTAALTRSGRFDQQKGKLPWPAKGKVVSQFGRHKHPIFNTITENLGIEIKAPLGSPVIVVDQGQVQTITWQRGLGNILIINHYDGYYTVYTHLEEISVSPQQNVKAGDVIGTVGDSGSLNGPVLLFQIWKNTINLDPEDWIL